jgi:ubiquinone/menaquinone biosynthesis C-methylase UbiE
MDARDLKFDDASFDTIIDKGCFDAVSCAVDSKSNAIDVMNSVYRTLRPGGKFVVRTKHFALMVLRRYTFLIHSFIRIHCT